MSINLNRVIRLSDFEDPELAPIIAEVYGAGVSGQGAHRKAWEVAMAVATARRFEKGGPYAWALGLGAGTEPTSFLLTRTFGRVTATDLYRDPGAWSGTAPPDFLLHPERYAPAVDWQPERLTALHMDMRYLQFPDETFDFIYSSGSIEHVSDEPKVVDIVMTEACRVLKPGGILSLSTEFNLNGAPGTGWPGVMVFTPEMICEYLFDDPDFELVDPHSWEWETDAETLATEAPLLEFIKAHQAGDHKLPDVVLSYDGYVFTSVHLALRKRS